MTITNNISIVFIIIIIIAIIYYCYYYYRLFNMMFWLLLLPSFLLLALLNISNTFLNTLVPPNNAVFFINPTMYVVPSFSFHLSNSFMTLPRAPITTGTTSTVLSFDKLSNSLFKSWYFSTFSLSFSSTLTSVNTAILMIIYFRSFLLIAIISGLLTSITLSH